MGDLRERIRALEEQVLIIRASVSAIHQATAERAKAEVLILQRLFALETTITTTKEADIKRRERTKTLITWGAPTLALLATGSWDKAMTLLKALLHH